MCFEHMWLLAVKRVGAQNDEPASAGSGEPRILKEFAPPGTKRLVEATNVPTEQGFWTGTGACVRPGPHGSQTFDVSATRNDN